MTEKEAYQKGYDDALRDIMQDVQIFYKEEARPNGNMSDEEKAEAMMKGFYMCDEVVCGGFVGLKAESEVNTNDN